MNKMFIIGNVTNAPEIRATNNGTSVCTFTVAVNRSLRPFANMMQYVYPRTYRAMVSLWF